MHLAKNVGFSSTSIIINYISRTSILSDLIKKLILGLEKYYYSLFSGIRPHQKIFIKPICSIETYKIFNNNCFESSTIYLRQGRMSVYK